MGSHGPALTRVLVTGASGFLGRVVTTTLAARGHAITAHGLSSSNIGGDTTTDIIRADLADPQQAHDALSPWRWDAVVHLAGPVTAQLIDLSAGADLAAAHVRIALHLATLARARIVHASSMSVYGMPRTQPIAESHARQPTHAYGLAKALAEDVLALGPADDVWTLRLPGLFAESRKSGALFHFCRAAARGEPLAITAPAPTPWDILHVEDAADAVALALEAPRRAGGAINIAYGEPITLDTIAAEIVALSGRGSSIDNRSGVTHPVWQLDVTKAKQQLGWNPPSLRERLARLYAAVAA